MDVSVADLVQEILGQTDQTSPPVRMAPVTELLGVTVVLDPSMPSGLDGFLHIEGFTRTIVVRSLSRRTRIPSIGADIRARWSIAHEVGHLCLHADEYDHAVFAHLDTAEPFDDVQRVEQEANAFAAELLMPEAWLCREYEAHPAFDYLRDRFWVSKQALSRRLRDLTGKGAIARQIGCRRGARDFPAEDIWLCEGIECDPYRAYLMQRGRIRDDGSRPTFRTDGLQPLRWIRAAGLTTAARVMWPLPHIAHGVYHHAPHAVAMALAFMS